MKYRPRFPGSVRLARGRPRAYAGFPTPVPRVHQVASLVKRWLMGTHQGAVAQEHLDYYLDEFTFRFNRRRSANRDKCNVFEGGEKGGASASPATARP